MKLASQELTELLKRRLEDLPSQRTPLAPPWIDEVLPLLVSLGKKLDEVAKRLDRIEHTLEEVKQLLATRS